MRLPRSLQGRLLVLVLSLVVGVWLATAAATWLDARHELDELLDGHLAQAAALLVAQQAHEFDEEEAHVDAPSLHRYAPSVAFQVFNQERQVAHSANAPTTPMGDRAFQSGFKTVRIGGTTWRVFAAYGHDRDIRVYVGEQMSSRASILWAILRSTLWPLLLALPVLALAAWWAVREGVAPLHDLGRALSERQPKALHPVVLERVPPEMSPMLDALNGLLTRIAELMESERRFTADAAHELRTPIAAIRTQAQVAMAETDDALRRHALQATLEGCDRATRLVEQLLTLSRLETGTPPVLAQLDLPALVKRVVADLAPAAIHKQQVVELEADAPCTVPGDPTLLSVLIRNLVDNAIRYSPEGAQIRVRLVPQGPALDLLVEDSGPGMKASDRARIGERFFRVMGTGQSGSGLGWSIVQRIAAAHQAEVQVANSAELGGLQVRVHWPDVIDQSSSRSS
ncbi:MAG: ATP-binding protein [Acidobacteriota bacterium]